MLTILNLEQLLPGHYVTRVVEQSGDSVIKSRGLIRSEDAIIDLASKGIQVVEVDLDKSKLAKSENEQTNVVEDASSAVHKRDEASGDDLSNASDLYSQTVSMQGKFVKLLQKGVVNDLSDIKNLSQNLIENLFDNPSAMLCLTMIKDTDQYMLEHSINCSILMALLAEHLGYDAETIEALSLGAMLMDVGMARIPDDLRDSNQTLTSADWAVIHSHVDEGLEMVDEFDDLPDIARTIIAQHHERLDGSGYPNGLAGDDIAVFARMAAIVDTYDAMVSERPHRSAIPPAVAMKRLMRTPGLDESLVRQFIGRLGIHPVGSLVKLTSGKIGIVAKTNPQDMLNPVVMTFYSIKGQHYNDVKRIDLSKMDDDIETSVQPSDFNINLPKFFREVFVGQA